MNRQFPALSGIAIALVVLHHTIDLQLGWFADLGIPMAGTWQGNTLVVLHRLGKVAVPLFLFVSGSFIAYAAQGNPPRLSWQTVRSALTRLAWPYLLWSCVFYVMVFAQKGEVHSPLGYVKSLLVGYPFHFVPLLAAYYAIAPFLARFAKRYGVWLLAAILAAQIVLINLVYPGTWGFTFPASFSALVPPVLGGTFALWGIYFPLGLVYSLNAKRVQPWLRRAMWPLLALTLLFYGLDVLHTAGLLHAPYAVHIYPLTFLGLAPLVKRNAIPAVKQFEEIGKRSYGLYLTHLIVISLIYWAIGAFAPQLFRYPLALTPPVFALALGLPLLLMRATAHLPNRGAYRYAFG